MWLYYFLLVVLSAIVLLIVWSHYITEVKIMCLLSLLSGPKFRDEIEAFISDLSLGRLKFHWIVLNLALDDLLQQELIQRKMELHPVTKDKQWRYRINRTRGHKKEKFSFRMLKPNLEPGYTFCWAPVVVPFFMLKSEYNSFVLRYYT